MSRSAHFLLSTCLVVLVLALSSGCTQRLTFNAVNVDPASANVGDTVHISWSYDNDDLLDQQFVNLRTVTVTGVQESLQTLGATARETQFVFQTPVTVELIGRDTDGVADRVAFDVTLAGNAFFHGPAKALTDVGYPRLGYVTQSVEGGTLDPGETFLNFQQFVGFFDPPGSQNGRVDSLVNLLPTDAAFRAFSLNVNESDKFGEAEGCLYPLLSLSNPNLGVANAMVFGGALAYSGDEFIIKAPNQVFFSGRHARSITFEPIFMAMAFNVGFNAHTMDLVEIELGNLDQGLVTTLFASQLGETGIGTASFQETSDGTKDGEISGNFKGAVVGFPVTTNNGDIFDALVRFDCSFNMPFLFDSELANQILLSKSGANTLGGPAFTSVP